MEGIAIITIVLGGLILCLFLLAIIYMSRVKRVPPDKMMLYWGPGAGDKEHDYSIAGSSGAFIWPFFGKYRFLPVDVRTMEIIIEDIPTADLLEDLKIDVDFVTQVRLSPDPDKIHQAVENLMDLRDKEINVIARNQIIKEARSILQNYKFYEVNSDRDKYALMIQKEAEKELAKIGMEVRSLVMKGIGDRVGFNASLTIGSQLIRQVESGELFKFDEKPSLSKMIIQETPDKERASRWMRIGEFHFDDKLHPHALYCYYQAMANDPSNSIYSVKAEEAFLSIKEKLISKGYKFRGDEEGGYQFWMGDEPPEIRTEPADPEKAWSEYKKEFKSQWAQRRFKHANKMMDEGHLRYAINDYEMAVELDPENVEFQQKLDEARRLKEIQRIGNNRR